MKEIREQLRKLTIMVTAMMSGDAIATPAELDDKYGDIKIPLDPKQWRGPSYKGRPASQCPPEFLDMVASFFQWAGETAEREGTEYKGKPEAPRKFRDARLARGWALRHRLSGKTFDTPKPATSTTTAPTFGSSGSFGSGGGFSGGTTEDAFSDGELDDAASALADADIPFILDMTGRSFDRP